MTDRKAVFDAVAKHIPGIWNIPGTITIMDHLIDIAEADQSLNGRKIGPKGLALIKKWEGCRLTAYPDPGTGGAPWTIGWGTTRINGQPVKPGQTITQVEADRLLEQQLVSYAEDVTKALAGAPTTQEQFDALVSFHYNTGAISKATLTKLHRAGDYAGAAKEFGKWIMAGGKKLQGLVNRRADEAALYRAGS